MQTIGDRADFPAGTAVSGRSTADSSGIIGPFTACDALMREREALVYHRHMLKRKRTELEQSLQKQSSENEVGPSLFVFSSAEALLMSTRYDRVNRTFSTKGTAHQCVHNSAVLSSWPTPIGSGVGATGMNEYQKSFHAHYLTRTLRHAEKLYLRSANQDDVVRTLATVQTAPMLRRLELDMPVLSESTAHSIYRLETEGQLECVSIRLHHIKSTLNSLCSLSSLRTLDLSHTKITNDDLRYLQGCHNLVELNLSFCCDLTDISPISHITTLKILELYGCQRLFGVGALGRLPSLKILQINETAVTDDEIRLLSQSQSLVVIELRSCEALTNVNPLSSILTLEVIDLSGCTSLTRVGALGKLPVLKCVYLNKTRIKDEEILLLSECHTLLAIELRSCEALTNVNPLSSAGTLELIDLSGCTSLTRVDALGKLPALKEVGWSFTRITDDEIRLLSQSRSVVKILLESCEALTNVNPLSSILTLEVIDLSGCTSLTCVGALGKLPALIEVGLSFTRITDDEIRLLSQSRSVVKILLESCEALTNVNPLSSILTLEVIDLSGCTSLTRVGALGKLPVLKCVYLNKTRIKDEEIRLLSECHTLVNILLKSCEALTNVNPLSSILTLEVIDLSGCTSLTCVGALGKLPALKEVGLSFTCITDDEIRLLSQSRSVVKILLESCEALTNVNPLSSIATLEVIDLSGCTSLTHVGALGKLPVLNYIDLNETCITDEEVNCLTSLRQQLGLPPIGIIRYF